MQKNEVGSPGRIRTSDMTVNSRPLYRLSYRGVLYRVLSCTESELLSISAYRCEIKHSTNQLTAPDIIAGDGPYESIRLRAGSLGHLGAAQRLVLYRTHRLDRIGNVPGRENAGQTGKNRIGIERSAGLENSP